MSGFSAWSFISTSQFILSLWRAFLLVLGWRERVLIYTWGQRSPWQVSEGVDTVRKDAGSGPRLEGCTLSIPEHYRVLGSEGSAHVRPLSLTTPHLGEGPHILFSEIVGLFLDL